MILGSMTVKKINPYFAFEVKYPVYVVSIISKKDTFGLIEDKKLSFPVTTINLEDLANFFSKIKFQIENKFVSMLASLASERMLKSFLEIQEEDIYYIPNKPIYHPPNRCFYIPMYCLTDKDIHSNKLVWKTFDDIVKSDAFSQSFLYKNLEFLWHKKVTPG